jgi:hypothetical protein
LADGGLGDHDLESAADENGAMTKLTDSLFACFLEEDADDECRS